MYDNIEDPLKAYEVLAQEHNKLAAHERSKDFPQNLTADVVKGLVKTQIQGIQRTLAKKLHPDRNPGDKVAEQIFVLVNKAWGVLGDDEKRKQYDEGKLDFEGEPKGIAALARKTTPAEAFQNLSDYFSDGPTERRPAAGPAKEDKSVLSVTYAQVAAGEKVTVTLPNGKTVAFSLPKTLEDGKQLKVAGEILTVKLRP